MMDSQIFLHAGTADNGPLDFVAIGRASVGVGCGEESGPLVLASVWGLASEKGNEEMGIT
ncbi:hypothetical protein HPP92_027913 [Vanilla planifolia]|uniref:Uncharacterized protein n=1 Tax=Vanilla planifolia TaxID=51239 RepID=A0A835U3M5_VANPL|nr:hypothetical protein HPP92_027913 [Vanilla planifolia]